MIVRSPYPPYDEAIEVKELVRDRFRGEEYEHFDYFYRDSQGNEFTTAEQGDKGLNEMYDAYRKRHGIATVEQIRELRSRCGLSASKMSLILGFGPNQYRLYEKGTVPNESNGKILALLAQNNDAMLFYVNAAKNYLTKKEYATAVAGLCRHSSR